MACFAMARAFSTFAALMATVDASGFLGAKPQHMRMDEVEQLVRSELYALAGSAEVRDVEEELRPLFASLPKDEQGALEPSVVRYAAHRYFTHKHGWHLKGLRQAGSTWNASSPAGASIMKEQAPAYVQSLFEQRLQTGGLGLRDLAVFVVTLSDLVRKDVVGALDQIYDARGLARSGRVRAEVFDSLIDPYLAVHIQGSQTSEDMTPESIWAALRDAIEFFLDWDTLKTWAQDLRHTLDHTQQSRRNPFEPGIAFEDAVEYVQELAHRFGSTQNEHCRSLKDMLVDMEHQGTGRVPLSKFYSGYRDSEWPFYETVEYLRAQGALDEADPLMPSVIIPNYIGGAGNCLEPSGFYSVCCRDECEGLMSRVEHAIAGPAASPARIAEVVAHLSSETVDAPRNLSSAHLTRLEEIAKHHGGSVPLHGRLFSQWMHHAYPRECPFPHVSGTTNPAAPLAFNGEPGGTAHEASDHEMDVWIVSDMERKADLVEVTPETLPWTAVEELVTSREHTREASGSLVDSSSCVRAAALLAAVALAAWPAARSSKAAWTGSLRVKPESHMV